MKIVMVARRYWPAIGGVESYLRDLARELAIEHEVTVAARRIDEGPITRLSDSLTGPAAFEPFVDGRVEVVPLDIPRIRRAALLPLLGYVVPGLRRYAWGGARIPSAYLYARVVAPLIARQARGADIVHAWSGDLLGLAAVRAARFCGAASAVTASIHPGEYGTGPVDMLVYSAVGRVVAQLEAEADAYRSLGVPSHKITVCGAASGGVSRNGHEGLRSRYGIPGPMVLFVGRRPPHKGQDVLLDAANQVPEATFVFVGPGPPLEPRGGRVLDIGAVSDGERDAWIRAADLLCLPSSAESFGIVVLEAWSAETPVLTSDIAPLAELVRSTGGGFAVARDSTAIAELLRELLASPEQLRAAGAAGARAWRERYTPAVVAARHLEMYAELMRAGRTEA